MKEIDLEVATMTELLELISGKSVKKKIKMRGCVLCDKSHAVMSDFIDHLKEDHMKEYLILEFSANDGRFQVEVDRQQTQVGNRLGVSNRTLIKQMELWGWVQGKHHHDQIAMIPPDKKGFIYVNKPDVSSNNVASVFVLIYAATKTSADAFWSKGQAVKEIEVSSKVKEEVDVSRTIGVSTRVLGLLLIHDRTMTVNELMEMTNFTRGQIFGAMQYNCTHGWAEKIKSGAWVATHKAKSEHQHTVTVNRTFTDHPSDLQPASLPASQPALPQTPSEPAGAPQDPRVAEVRAIPVPGTTGAYRAVTEDEVFDVLDILIPEGFKARDFLRVNAWVQATQELVAKIRADQ